MARTLLTDAIDPSVADSSIAPAKLSASIRSIYHLTVIAPLSLQPRLRPPSTTTGIGLSPRAGRDSSRARRASFSSSLPTPVA